MPRAVHRWQLAAVAILVCLVVTSLLVRYRALDARDQAKAESNAATQIAVSFTPLNLHASAVGELIPSRANFRDAAVFHNRVYLCAPGGLYGYDANGVLLESYRSGAELPAGELIGVASSVTELLITTAGAGILEFNGTAFRQLLPVDLHLRNFTAVLHLNGGRSLFGTSDHGVCVWDGKKLADFLPALNHEHVTAIAGADADIWIGTLAHGAYRFHAGQLDHLAVELPDPRVLAIELSEESAYVGTPVGVVEFRDGRKVRNLADGYFALSLSADGESLAVGTEDEGVVTIPLRTGARLARAAAVTEIKAPVERILRLDGVRYALAGALYRSDAPRSMWTRVTEQGQGALTDRNVASLAIAHDGRLWIGYFDRGLDVADSRFENVRHFEDDHLFCVNRIVEEEGGARTAVATANGLVVFDATLNVRQVLGRKEGLLADHVTDVLFRHDGMVIATPAGLSMAGANGVRNLYVFQGLVNNHVYSLASDGDRLAAGTLGGLSLLDKDVVQVNFTTANSGLKHNWISALTRVGDDWFAGTYGAGVMRLDAAGQWQGFADLKGGFEVNPNAMVLAGNSLYVGSLAKGLWIYSRKSGRWTNILAGLPSLNVTAVAAGGGYIYVGTDNGLARFREESLLKELR